MNKMHSEWRRLRNNLEMQAKMSSMLTIQFGINLTRICLFKKLKNFSEYTRKYNRSAQENHKNVIEATLNTGIKRNHKWMPHAEIPRITGDLSGAHFRYIQVRRCLKARSFFRGKSQNTCSLKRQRKGLSKYSVPLRRHDKHHSSSLWVEDLIVNKNVEGKRTYPSPNKPKGNGWS